MGKYNLKDEENFEKVKSEAEVFYAGISEVACPYFGEKIAFNAKGLRHLKFKFDKKARPHKDQYARLKLLKFVPEVLKKSHLVQGIWETKKFEIQNRNSRWEKILKNVFGALIKQMASASYIVEIRKWIKTKKCRKGDIL